MRKTAFILAAFAIAACSRTESESHGEVVDTLNTPNLEQDLGIPRDTTGVIVMDSLTDTAASKKPFGRKPVDMKDSLRRP